MGCNVWEDISFTLSVIKWEIRKSSSFCSCWLACFDLQGQCNSCSDMNTIKSHAFWSYYVVIWFLCQNQSYSLNLSPFLIQRRWKSCCSQQTSVNKYLMVKLACFCFNPNSVYSFFSLFGSVCFRCEFKLTLGTTIIASPISIQHSSHSELYFWWGWNG